MDFLNEFLGYIARTNLFNFVIFLGIIIFLVKKLDVKSQVDKAKTEVDETIHTSESVKTESEQKLSNVEESMAHLEEEVDEIIKEAENNAKLVGEKILEDAKKNALVIKENAGKALENSRLLIKNDLIRRASIASVEVAKLHIIEELNRNADLHAKLIDESIEALEGVQAE